jgi:sugar diacid utilization regulator
VVDGPKSTDTTLAEALRRFVADLPCTCLPGTVHWSPLPHIPIVVSVKAAKSWEDLTRRARDVASPLEAAAVRHGLIVVTSAPTESLERLPVTYRRAHGSLGFLAAARSEPGVVSSRRMEMFSLVAGDGQDIGRLTRWVNEVLGPLDRHPKAELMRAIIQAYYRSSGRWTGVGELTGLHRSTFMPYVRLIEELTGLHFDRSADVHELLTAYRLGEFLRDQFEKLESLDRPG